MYRYLVKRFVPSIFEPETRQSGADRTTTMGREKSDNGNDDDAPLCLSIEDGPSWTLSSRLELVETKRFRTVAHS